MDWKKLACALVVGGALIGCGGGDGGDDGGDPGMTYTYVVNHMIVGQADPAGDPTIVPGFNLDDMISTDADAAGCFHADFTSPPPDNETGVDNQLGPVLGGLGDSFDVDGSIAENIASGDLLILMEVEGVNGFTNDRDVTVNLYLGVLPAGVMMPMLGGDGRLAPGQTIDVDARSLVGGEPLVSVSGEIANGRLRAGPVDIQLNITVMAMPLALNIRSAQLRFNITESGLSQGVLGGSLNIDETIMAVMMVAPDIDEGLIRMILEGQADLEPDMMGMCQSVSVALVFDATTAVRGMTVTPMM